MNDAAPRYVTLRDYLRVLREQRLLIVLVTLVFGGAALAVSNQEDKVYETQASVAYTDPAQDLDLVGGVGSINQTPQERAAANAQQIRTPEIVQKAKEELKSSEPLSRLIGAVQGLPAITTNFVIVRVRWGDPKFASAFANAVAEAHAADVTREVRKRFSDAAKAIRKSLKDLTKPRDQLNRQLQIDRLSRIESVRSLSEPARVVQRAGIPGTPVSPRPVRNTLLGLLLGLTIGVLGAFVRDALDRRLRSAKEISEEMHLPVLGYLRDEVLGRTVLANGKRALTDADFEAFRIMRTNLDFLDVDKPLTTVAITSALPEEGKSTVSQSLACAYVLNGKRALLVECDLRRPTLAARFDVPAEPGLTDYLVGTAGPTDILRTVPLAAPAHNGDESGPTLVCIPAGTSTPRPAELLGSQRFAAFLEQVREAYDVVILDTSPLLSVVDTLELIPRVDGVVVCVRAQQTTREQARAARNALEHFPERPTGVVVTGVRAGDEVDYGYYSYSYAYGSRS